MTTYIGNPPKSVYGVKDATNLLYDYEVPSTTNEIILENIFGEHKSFTVEIDSKYTGTGNSMYFYVNDDAVNANYRYHDHYLDTGAPQNVQGHGANPYLGWMSRTAYYKCTLEFSLVPDLSGDSIVMVHNKIRQIGEASPYDATIVDNTGKYVVPISSLNKLRIWIDGTTKIPAGTRVRVYSKEATNLVLPLEYSAPRKNILMNTDFAINQREYVNGTATTSGTYYYDRWYSNLTDTNMSVSGIVLTIDHVNAGWDGAIAQSVEKGQLVIGEQYVLSWEGTAEGSVWYANGSSSNYQSSPIIFTATSATGNRQEIIQFKGDGATLSKVKLEKGTSATPWEKPDIPTELARCERYFQRIKDISGNKHLGMGYIWYTTLPKVHVDYSRKRTNPTVSFTSLLALRIGGKGNLYQTSTNITVIEAHPTGCGLQVTIPTISGVAAGEGCDCVLRTGYAMDISAEL